MNKKKIIALIIAISILLIAVMGVFLYNRFFSGEYENISWKYRRGVLTISGEGEMPELEDSPWWKYAESTKEIVIEEGITSIEKEAFMAFLFVKKVTIPDSVKKIDENAFEMCQGLQNLNLGNGVVTIEKNAFLGCNSLESVTIPDSVESLKDGAFGYCEKLKSVYIGAGVKEVGFGLFDGFRNEVSVTLSEGNQHITIENGVFFDKSKSVLLYYPEYLKHETYSIPEGVETVKKLSFANHEHLKEIITPTTLKTIEDAAFYNCVAIEKIYIGKNVSEIGKVAICTSGKLTEISVSEENPTFSSMEGVLFNKDKTKLIQYPNAKKTALYEIPKGVLEIEKNAFSNAEITGIILSETISKIGDSAFWNSTVEELAIPKSVKTIGKGISEWCGNLEKIHFEGNKAEWEKLAGKSYFDSRTSNHEVICSDGIISVITDERDAVNSGSL